MMNESSKKNDRPNILIVDDIPSNIALLKQFLESQDMIVHSETNPSNAMTKLESEKFNLLLLDINMPGLSGIEILKKIRKKFDSTELPIIMVTANIKEESVVQSLNLGANDYICKPINLDITLARVKNQLLISQFAATRAKLTEIKAINSMIVTYNHEINNPLSLITVCAGELEGDAVSSQKDTILQLKKSIDRIITVVNKIQNLKIEDVEYKEYSNKSSMVKI